MSAAILNFPVSTTLDVAEKKSNHQANIVRVTELLPHLNADSLSLVHIGGYQVVVRKGQFAVGDLAVYIQPDSIVPQTEPFKFIWETFVGLDGTVLEKRRRITVRKFRGEWSEGLLLPTSDFPELTTHNGAIDVVFPGFTQGTDVSDILGITHYDPDAGVDGVKDTSSAPKRKFRYPRSIRGWFNFIKRLIVNKGRVKELTVDVSFQIPTYDVEAFKNYAGTFVDGETVVVTEKIHGSNARFIYLEGTMYAGSRNQWKAPGSGTWHKALVDNPWIEAWCREHEGYALYGEVTPTQKGFTYNSGDKVRFFAFDVYTPEKKWQDFDDFNNSVAIGQQTEAISVPILYYGPYDKEKILKLVDGPSFIRLAGHIREGIVIKTVKERTQRGLGRAQLKIVSNAFLEKDSKVAA